MGQFWWLDAGDVRKRLKKEFSSDPDALRTDAVQAEFVETVLNQVSGLYL
jgi:hypothetical protein